LSRFDLLIKNGTIIDSSGSQRFKGDVAVEGKIVETGDLVWEDRAMVIDATGKYVAPGFIDTHAHSDGTILVHLPVNVLSVPGYGAVGVVGPRSVHVQRAP
jgi:N-acyl-D-aspartate/D-glutamate deacylase